MIERICPQCKAGNSMAAQQCGACGADLEEPVNRPARLLRRLPAVPVRLQHAGMAAALGAVALAVEAGAAWLKQRGMIQAELRAEGKRPTRPSGFVAQQRIWETYEEGTLRQRVVEQTIWRLDDQ